MDSNRLFMLNATSSNYEINVKHNNFYWSDQYVDMFIKKGKLCDISKFAKN